ncbi:MAG: endonuclease/exonuclease/phosphatase family protein [Rubrivivax sp.]
MAFASPATPLRVLTVNIHKGYTQFRRRSMLHELREAVRAEHSDVVFLQEVEGTDRPPHGAHGEIPGTQVEFLADQVWTDHAYGRNAVATGTGTDHGNALLSRHPILSWRNHDVSLPPAEPRGLLHSTVAPSGERAPLHLVCVHLGLRESHRRQQLARLRSLLLQVVPADAPLVVAGDFNDWRVCADRALHGSGLREVFRHAHGRHARSFPARWPLLALDRIYVRGVASHRPLTLPREPWSRLSDHAPLAAEIVL